MTEPVLIPLDDGTGRAVLWWEDFLVETKRRFGKAGGNQYAKLLAEWGARRRVIDRKRYLEFKNPSDAAVFLLRWT